MASEKQLQANRQNCLNSTGPKTPEGKEISARNAIQHGALAKDLLIRGEDPEELKNLIEGVFESLPTETYLDQLLVGQVILEIRRLHRVQRAETKVIEYHNASIGAGETLPFISAYVRMDGHFEVLYRYESKSKRDLFKLLDRLKPVKGPSSDKEN